jgi:hypothetical protein
MPNYDCPQVQYCSILNMTTLCYVSTTSTAAAVATVLKNTGENEAVRERVDVGTTSPPCAARPSVNPRKIIPTVGETQVMIDFQ